MSGDFGHGATRALAAALLLASATALGGCAAATYAGIPLAAGAADPQLQELARRARAGDKQAQLELGIRYEEGRGVQRDLGRAQRFYEAASSGFRLWLYLPPVGRGSASFFPAQVGRGGPVEARRRLARLRSSRLGALEREARR